MESPLFTPQQLKYLAEVYGINPHQDVLQGADGLIIKGKTKTVWLKKEYGPREVDVNRGWSVIKDYADKYYTRKPTGKFVYDS